MSRLTSQNQSSGPKKFQCSQCGCEVSKRTSRALETMYDGTITGYSKTSTDKKKEVTKKSSSKRVCRKGFGCTLKAKK